MTSVSYCKQFKPPHVQSILSAPTAAMRVTSGQHANTDEAVAALVGQLTSWQADSHRRAPVISYERPQRRRWGPSNNETGRNRGVAATSKLNAEGEQGIPQLVVVSSPTLMGMGDAFGGSVSHTNPNGAPMPSSMSAGHRVILPAPRQHASPLTALSSSALAPAARLTGSSSHLSGFSLVFNAALQEEPPIGGPVDVEVPGDDGASFRQESSTSPLRHATASVPHRSHSPQHSMRFTRVESAHSSPHSSGSPVRHSSFSRTQPQPNQYVSATVSAMTSKGCPSEPASPRNVSSRASSHESLPLLPAASRRLEAELSRMPPDPRRLTRHLAGPTAQTMKNSTDEEEDESGSGLRKSVRGGHSSGASSRVGSQSRLIPLRPVPHRASSPHHTHANSNSPHRQLRASRPHRRGHHPAIDEAARVGGSLAIQELAVYYKADTERAVAALVALYRNPATPTDEVSDHVLNCVRQCQLYAEHLVSNSYFAEAFGLLEEAERLLDEERDLPCELQVGPGQAKTRFHRRVLDTSSDAVSALRRRSLYLLRRLDAKRMQQEEYERLGALPSATGGPPSRITGTHTPIVTTPNRRQRHEAKGGSLVDRQPSTNSRRRSVTRGDEFPFRPPHGLLDEYVRSVPPPVWNALSPTTARDTVPTGETSVSSPPPVSRSGAAALASPSSLATMSNTFEGAMRSSLTALSPRRFYFKQFDPDVALESVARQEDFIRRQRTLEQHRAAAGVGCISPGVGVVVPMEAETSSVSLVAQPSLSRAHSPAHSSSSISFRGIPLPVYDDASEGASLLFGSNNSSRRQLRGGGSSPTRRGRGWIPSDTHQWAHTTVPAQDVACTATANMMRQLQFDDEYEYENLINSEGMMTGTFENGLPGAPRGAATSNLPDVLATSRHCVSAQQTPLLPHQPKPTGGAEEQAIAQNPRSRRAVLRPKPPEVLEAIRQRDMVAASAILTRAHANGTLSTFGESPYLWSPTRPLGSGPSPPRGVSPTPSSPFSSAASEESHTTGFPLYAELTQSHLEGAALAESLRMASRTIHGSSTIDIVDDTEVFLARLKRSATVLNATDGAGVLDAMSRVEQGRKAAHEAINASVPRSPSRPQSKTLAATSPQQYGSRSESPASLAVSSSRRDSGAAPSISFRRKEGSVDRSKLPPLPAKSPARPQSSTSIVTSQLEPDILMEDAPNAPISIGDASRGILDRFTAAVSTLTAHREAVELERVQQTNRATWHLDHIEQIAPHLVVSAHLHSSMKGRAREMASAAGDFSAHKPTLGESTDLESTQGSGCDAPAPSKGILHAGRNKVTRHADDATSSSLGRTQRPQVAPSMVTFDGASLTHLVPPRRFANNNAALPPADGSPHARKGKGKRVSMENKGQEEHIVTPNNPSPPSSARVAGGELFKLRALPDWTTLSTTQMLMVFELVRGTRVLQRAFRVFKAKKRVAAMKSAVHVAVLTDAKQLDAQLMIACAWRQFSARLRSRIIRIRAQYLIEQRVELEKQGSYAAGLMMLHGDIRPRSNLGPSGDPAAVSASSMGSLRVRNRVKAGPSTMHRAESSSSSTLGGFRAVAREVLGGSSPTSRLPQRLQTSSSVGASPGSVGGLASSRGSPMRLRFEMPFSGKDPRYGALRRIQAKISQRIISRAWRSYQEYETVEAQLEAEIYLDHLLGRTPFPFVSGTRSALVGEGAAGLVTHTLQEAMERRERRLARVAKDASRLHLAGPNRARRLNQEGGTSSAGAAPLSVDSRTPHPPLTALVMEGAGGRRISRRHSSLKAFSRSGSAVGLFTVGSNIDSDDYEPPSDADSVDVEMGKLERIGGYETTYTYRAIPGSDEFVLVPIAVPTGAALAHPSAGSDHHNSSDLMSLIGSSSHSTSVVGQALGTLMANRPTPPRRFSSRAVMSWGSRGSPQSDGSPRGPDTDIGHLSSDDNPNSSPRMDVDALEGGTLAAHGRLVVKKPKLKALRKVDVRALKEQAEVERQRAEAFRLAELERHRELEREKLRGQEWRAQQATVLQKAGRGYLRRIDLVAVLIAKLSADVTYGHLLSELTAHDPAASGSVFGPSASMAPTRLAATVFAGGELAGNASLSAATSSMSEHGEPPTESILSSRSSVFRSGGSSTLQASPSQAVANLLRSIHWNSPNEPPTGAQQTQQAGFMATLSANPHLQVSTLVRLGHWQDAALPTRACLEVTRDIYHHNPSLFPEAALLAARRREVAVLTIQACARGKLAAAFAHAMVRCRSARRIQQRWRSWRSEKGVTSE